MVCWVNSYQTYMSVSIIFRDGDNCLNRSNESLCRQLEFPCAIYSILVYFVMFSFRVLTLRIYQIILILNKLRPV